MKKMAAYAAIQQVFQNMDRRIHRSNRGVFLMADDFSGYHDFRWEEYPVTSTRGPYIPRLRINTRWASERLPMRVAKRWGVETGSYGLFCDLDLEITVLEHEIATLVLSLPAIILHIESGNRSDFEKNISLPVIAYSATNIWSHTANTYANDSKK